MELPSQLRLGAVLAALLLLGACSSSNTPIGEATADAGASSDQKSWLYSIQSDGPTTFDADTGQLSMPTDLVHAFTDRPYRDTRLSAPSTFAELWKAVEPDSFAQDPPNAVLTYWDGDEAQGAPQTVVCELTGDVAFDRDSSTLSMGVRVIEPEGAALPATMARASLFVDDGPDCYDSGVDEKSIEYFNLINYMGEFAIKVTSAPSAGFDLEVLCPQPQSSDMPPQDFALVLRTVAGDRETSCYGGSPLRIAPTDASCDSGGECRLLVIAENAANDTIYSQTEVEVPLRADRVINPELNPAAPPVCTGSSAAPSEGATRVTDRTLADQRLPTAP